MGRPRKHVRDADKPRRSFNEIKAVVDMAMMFFFVLGGESLDKQLRSMDHTADMYDAQVQASAAYGNEAAAAYGPNISGYEARMSASTFARLESLRQKKMAQCFAWAEEAADAEREAAGGAAEPMPDVSAKVGEAATASQPSPAPQAQPNDGDSPSAKSGRGQSPLGQSPTSEAPQAGPYEFADATKQPHPEALTTRIAQMLTNLNRD